MPGFRSILRPLNLLRPNAGLNVKLDAIVVVNSVDFTDYWIGPATVTQNEAGEIDTLSIQFQAKGSSLESDLVEWKEIIYRVNGQPYFGGYVTRITRLIDQDQPDGWNTYDVLAEGYETLLNRTPAVRRNIYGTGAGDILRELLNYALDPDGTPPAQTEFNATTYVYGISASSEAFSFLVDGDTLTDAIDRLALMFNCVWWIDSGKFIHFHYTTAEPSPFAIASVEDADYVASYPPNSKPSHQTDGSDIRNRITVYGGVKTVVVKGEEFAGDGVEHRFQLEHFPVQDMILITVDGVLQRWGTWWYHTWLEYDVLVDWSAGTMYFDPTSPPVDEAVIIASYTYGAPVTVRVDDGTELGSSYAKYGRWLDYEIIDRSITNEVAATNVANAMLAEFRWAVTTGSFAVERIGIKPGQSLTIDMPAIDLDGVYAVRRVVTEFKRNRAVCEVSFGGRRQSLGLTLNGSMQSGPLSASTAVAERHYRSLSNTSEKLQGAKRNESLVANTNTPSGATASALPIYDATGALVGYVPVYGSAW